MDIHSITSGLLAQPGYVRAVMAWVVGMIALLIPVGLSRWLSNRSRLKGAKGSGKRRRANCAMGFHDWAYPLSVERRCRRCRRIEMKVAGHWEQRPGYTYSETHR